MRRAGAEKPDQLSLTGTIELIQEGAAEAGVPAGIFCMTSAEAEVWADRLALVICGSDATLLIEGLETTFGS